MLQEGHVFCEMGAKITYWIEEDGKVTVNAFGLPGGYVLPFCCGREYRGFVTDSVLSNVDFKQDGREVVGKFKAVHVELYFVYTISEYYSNYNVFYSNFVSTFSSL